MPDITIPEAAMVFAAGFGKRMLPLTANMPKSLIKVNGKAMIDYVLNALAAIGVTKAIVNTHYLSDQIANHLKERKSPKIIISHETPIILETGGGIVQALPMLGRNPFYVINTDTLWTEGGEPALLRLAKHWNPEKMDALLLLAHVETAVGYSGKGDFNLLANGILQRSTTTGMYDFVYSGIMLIKPTVFNGLAIKPFSIFRDFLFNEPKYNNNDGSMPKLYGLEHTGQWLHVGTPNDIKPAEDAIRRIA